MSKHNSENQPVIIETPSDGEASSFSRTELLIGSEAAQRISTAKVILFGVGGVGSWCAESLVRSGIRHLTMVDSDTVQITNINRQLQATTQTIGASKVEVLKSRLLSINPYAQITAIQGIYNNETASTFNLNSYDYIIDAIDSLSNKAHLIVTATATQATFFSSMGAALKMNPSKIQVTEFWKVKGCPLAAALRRTLKKGTLPTKKFLCVFSDELLENKGAKPTTRANPESLQSHENPAANEHTSYWDSRKSQINGTLVHVTAIFGFTLAGLVIQDIIRKRGE
ncbi:MAG: tRNA threonylcarbamoyladenosine dehydratase [Tannerella sp.]|jgi:tRNA A37 threonylcarbamoyladenosine dehydratase|nr:tRNA threonylcarbamoyladenosine dehydratase [Tannerella sp.]